MNRGSPGAVVFIFILLFFLVAVAYYVGTSTDALALAKAGQQFTYAITGRTSSGTFAGYPTGGGTAPAINF